MCVVSNMCMSSSKIQHSHSVCDEGSRNLGRCTDDDICVTCLHQRQSRKHFFDSSFHGQMNKNKVEGTWMDIGALSIRTKHMIGIQHVTSIFSFTWTYLLFSLILFLGFTPCFLQYFSLDLGSWHSYILWSKNQLRYRMKGSLLGCVTIWVPNKTQVHVQKVFTKNQLRYRMKRSLLVCVTIWVCAQQNSSSCLESFYGPLTCNVNKGE